jgi:hypothetical protein
MGSGVGVLLTQLHCPTCGEQIVDFGLHSDPSDWNVDLPVRDIKASPAPWFLLCPQGHKWTVKTIWRCRNYPDRVQLGEYLGTV